MASNDNFEVDVAEFYMQYHNVIHNNESINLILKKIDKFRNGQVKNKHYILTFMMGITTHWVSLLAHKINGLIEFTYFDSRNYDYLGWTDEKI